jgi:hypothetical protein
MKRHTKQIFKGRGFIVAWVLLLLATVSITSLTAALSQNKANRAAQEQEVANTLFQQIQLIKFKLSKCRETLDTSATDQRLDRGLPSTHLTVNPLIKNIWCSADGTENNSIENNTSNNNKVLLKYKLFSKIEEARLTSPAGFGEWMFHNQQRNRDQYPNLSNQHATIYIQSLENNQYTESIFRRLRNYILPENFYKIENTNNSLEKSQPLYEEIKKGNNSETQLLYFFLVLDR